jgi:hypothetical protein
MSSTHAERIAKHYVDNWSVDGERKRWLKGPYESLPSEFHVLETPPHGEREMWTYATVCMSQPDDADRLELHLHAPSRSESHVELLTVVAYYHRTTATLGLGHTVNFGRPWLPGSDLTHGLLSLPYLDGPSLEFMALETDEQVRCLWLIPITAAERALKSAHGLEALEEKFEAAKFNYLDPLRPSVIE